MNLDTIRLENFRCFERLEVDFHEQLTVLIAKNGQGKSTVLDAIAMSLAPYVTQFEYGESESLPRLQEADVHRRRVTHPQEPSLFTTEKSPFPATIHSRYSHKNVLRYDKVPTLQNLASYVSSGMGELSHDVTPLPTFGKTLRQWDYDRKHVLFPVVAYYGTGRLHSQQSLAEIDIEEFTSLEESRSRGYYECLSSRSSYGHFLYGIKVWADESNNQYQLQQQGGDATNYYNTLITRVMKSIQDCLEDYNYQQLAYSYKHKDFIIHTPNGVLPLSQLSDGMRNIITMVGDIAYRLHTLNPWVEDDIEGVILIDEIEMHLHPSWQQTILGKLMKAFPQVQFIVTTHSPQVVSTVPQKCLRIIHDGEVMRPSAYTEGRDSAAILAEIMGVDPLPTDLEINKRYLHLLDMISREHDEEEMRKSVEDFGKCFGPDHPSHLDLQQQLRLREYKRRLAERKK